MNRDEEHSRRRLLGLAGAGAAALVGAVAGRRMLHHGPLPGGIHASSVSGERPTAPSTAVAAPSTVAPETTAAPAAQAQHASYALVPGEVHTEAKMVASRIAEELTNYGPRDSLDDAVERVIRYASGGIDASAVAAAAAVVALPGRASSGRVVYPQLGGLDPHRDPRRCSVMVVVEQQFDGIAVTRCLDIRLRRADTWRLEALADLSGFPVAAPADTSPMARRALEHERLELPDSARWDIYEGRVDDRVLTELVHLAEHVPIAVSTFCRGHPYDVFGTGRVSAHMAGRAVDVWAVGEPVVSQRNPGSVAHSVAQAIHREARVKNFGSPWAFDGAGGRSFTDPVHDDHFHLGF
jgi:hypothetical protein